MGREDGFLRLLEWLLAPKASRSLPCGSGPAASSIGRMVFSNSGPAVVAAICPTRPYTVGNSPELFTMASGDADRGVDQFMSQDRCDLHRQHVFRFAQVGPDEDLEMPILAALIIPAFAYVPAAPAA
jgi:hypothetical protein